MKICNKIHMFSDRVEKNIPVSKGLVFKIQEYIAWTTGSWESRSNLQCFIFPLSLLRPSSAINDRFIHKTLSVIKMSLKAVCFMVTVYLAIATCSSAETNSTLTSPNPNSSTQAKVSRAAKSGTKYIAFPENLNFFEAWQACESYGLRLAVVTSAADTREVKVALLNVNAQYLQQFWIAGTDLGRSRSFLWITTGQQIWRPNFYLNWYPGEPNNAGGNEHCVELYQESEARWNDRDCSTRHGYICQLDNPLCWKCFHRKLILLFC